LASKTIFFKRGNKFSRPIGNKDRNVDSKEPFITFQEGLGPQMVESNLANSQQIKLASQLRKQKPGRWNQSKKEQREVLGKGKIQSNWISITAYNKNLLPPHPKPET
jgi:hypothetical protein